MQLINDWVKHMLTYPPSEMFYQKYGPKHEKAEKRIKNICEDLYKFNWTDGKANVLGELKMAHREFDVLSKIHLKAIKPEYVLKAKEDFLLKVKPAIQAFELMIKKDQLLQEYYKEWKISYKDISDYMHKMYLILSR